MWIEFEYEKVVKLNGYADADKIRIFYSKIPLRILKLRSGAPPLTKVGYKFLYSVYYI